MTAANFVWLRIPVNLPQQADVPGRHVVLRTGWQRDQCCLGKAEEVPGTAALDTGGGAQLDSLSCASAGNCSAGGYYLDSSHHQQVFVVSQA